MCQLEAIGDDRPPTSPLIGPFSYGPKGHIASHVSWFEAVEKAHGDGFQSSMSSDRNRTARELLAFYLEAGVDAVLGETAVDRFTDTAEISPQPAVGRPADEAARAGAPQPGSRPPLDRSRPAATLAAPIPPRPTVAVKPAPDSHI